MYDEIVSVIEASLSKPRYSQGLVTVEKVQDNLKDQYICQSIINFRYTYDNLFSNDDLKQVIDYIKPDRGSRIGFIYHIIEDTHEDLSNQLLDLQNDTVNLITPTRQNYDCGHLWIEKKRMAHWNSRRYCLLLRCRS
ncbi:MAG: hypothetical protein K0B07_01270 [DPANN group archaeon]|nr:hypothetical protein [DPANN group archaeon]